jgi:L-asparaginase
MQSKTPASAGRTVILGTGGTIAGTADDPADNVGYRAAQIGVAQLVAAVPALAGLDLEAEQVAQLDSKDMDHATWQRLAQRVAHHLARDEVSGIVITHGTDTLEETAYFLHRVLAPAKPVVLTAAMRPATALLSDGPQNLFDAVCVARDTTARGVVAVLAGKMHSAIDVRKVHPYRLDAFGSGDAGPLGFVEEGAPWWVRACPAGSALGLAMIAADPQAWPRVEIVLSHAGAGAAVVEALRASGTRGIVVAGTGNGSVHHRLEAALREAQEAGIGVVRCTRCAATRTVGPASGAETALRSAGALSPVAARIELLLELLGRT